MSTTLSPGYRQIVAGLDLDGRSKHTRSNGQTVTLRFVLLHLIKETARHNGHIDILREMATASLACRPYPFTPVVGRDVGFGIGSPDS
jgi:hypothetical protein